MNNITFFTSSIDHDALLTEDKTPDFSLQSRNLTERRRISLSTPKPTSLYTSSRYRSFSFDHLSSMVQDLFVAGTETISNTLDWAILYVTYFPGVQARIFNEIDKVLGRERSPTESDRFKLPYIEAVISETMRYHCAGPILVPKSTTCDVVFKGYQIPENTFVMVNMWSCMRDPLYWSEPGLFQPMRFIDKEGRFDGRNPAMMPFSVGKRACTGEAVARLQMFLIFTSLLQKFSFTFSDERNYGKESLLRGIPGIGLYKSQDVSLKLKLR
jgi:cytochrome P450